MTLTVTRRAAVILLGLPLAAPMRIRPAWAAVCGAFDMAHGVRFERGDAGGSGLAQLDGDEVEILYDLPGKLQERRRVTGGVFEVERVVRSGGAGDLDGAEQICRVTYGADLPEVVAGGGWDGQVTEVCKEMATDTRAQKVLSESRTQWTASYRFGPMTELELSGCVHAVIEVTAIATSRLILREQRQVWFPALGLALEVGRNGVATPLTAMAPL